MLRGGKDIRPLRERFGGRLKSAAFIVDIAAMTLIRVRKNDIDPGKPLPWSLFDGRKRLIFKRGLMPGSMHQFEKLVANGLFRDSGVDRDSTPAAERQAPAETEFEDLPLDLVRLQIGDALQLQSQAGDGQSRHYVRLIGYLKGHSVFVTAPTQDGKVMLMREGQNFVVRAFCGKHAYAFPSTIDKVVNSPFPFLHLSYPASVRGLAVRRFARVDVQIIASISLAGDEGGTPKAATIVNLSLGGARIKASAPLARRGAEIVLKFRLDMNDVESYLVVPATVRAIAHDETDPQGLVEHGVEFGNVGQQDQLVMTAFVYQRLLEESSDL